MNDDGARRLMSAILKRAVDDYEHSDGCPEWCTVEECKNKKIDHNFCDAKKFIHSAWAATLCESLDLDHKKYVEVTMTKGKISKDTYRYIESELRHYKQTCKELESLKREIILETPEPQEGHSSTPGDPTGSKTAKILQDKRIRRLEGIVNAIRNVYEHCDESKKKLIEMKYWQNRYTDQGISYHLGVDDRTIRRWKQITIYAIAQELGYL